MAENSIMWTTGATGDGASSYTQAELVNFWLMKTFCGAMTNKGGVLLGVDNELEVTGTATPVAVNTGAAYVFGFPYENTASVDVAIPTPSSQTRVDYITLEVDWTAQTVRITRVAGTEGAGTPSLTQTENTEWQIPLATVSITTGGVITVTDQREFINPSMEISTSMIEADAVTESKIDSLAVTSGKLGADAVIAGKIADGAVDATATLANDIVDDTKVGDRVPQFYRREGGSSTNWHTTGTTTYTPGAVRMQGGAIEWTGAAASSGYVVVSYPTSFSYTPLNFVTADVGASDQILLSVDPGTVGFTIQWIDVQGSTHTSLKFLWLAIGPE